ncbi:hypothetical protein D9M68_451570 [compost metagenome]
MVIRPATRASRGTTEPMRVHQLPPSVTVWPDWTATGAVRSCGACLRAATACERATRRRSLMSCGKA